MAGTRIARDVVVLGLFVILFADLLDSEVAEIYVSVLVAGLIFHVVVDRIS